MRFDVLTVLSITISLPGYDAVYFDRYVTSKESATLDFRLEQKFRMYLTIRNLRNFKYHIEFLRILKC